LILLFYRLNILLNSNQFRVFLNAKPDLLSFFADLAKNNKLPSIEALLLQAGTLVDRYASQDAYEQALSKSDSTDAPEPMKVPFGPSWTGSSSRNLSSVAIEMEAREDTPNVSQSQDDNPPPLPSENLPKVHIETENFDGDRVLANSILFMQDFGWWIEIAYAVSEGDIG